MAGRLCDLLFVYGIIVVMHSSAKSFIVVSPSQIGILLECPRCLWLYFREGLKRPSGPFPSLPGGFDLLFKKYFDDYRQKAKLPPELEGQVDGKLFDDVEKLDTWRNNRRGISAEFTEMDLLLKGAIDDLIVNPSGEFVPLDFKTRGFELKEDTAAHYQTQLDLYTLLFKKSGHPVASYGYLLFFWPKKYGRHSADFNAELVKIEVSPERGFETLKEVMRIVKGSTPSASSDCGFCRFREFGNGG